MKKIFVSSPYSGDIETNVKNAIVYCKVVTRMGFLPIAPHLYFPQFLDDTDEVERSKGILMGCELMKDCDEVWVFGSRISKGMQQEIDFAEAINKPIQYCFDEDA